MHPAPHSQHTTHVDAARQAAIDLVAARRLGDDRQARRAFARLRRQLDAHIARFRAERSGRPS